MSGEAHAPFEWGPLRCVAAFVLPFLACWLYAIGVGEANPPSWTPDQAVRSMLLALAMMLAAVGMWTAPLAVLRLSALRLLPARLFGRTIWIWPVFSLLFVLGSAAAVRSAWPRLNRLDDRRVKVYLMIASAALLVSAGGQAAASARVLAGIELRRKSERGREP